MLENILIWYKNDPTAKNKVIFFVGLLIFFPLLFLGIWWINLPRNAENNSNLAVSSVSTRPKVTDLNFESSPQMELFDPQALGNVGNVFWQNGQVFSFTQSQNLKIDGQSIPGSPSFLPTSFYSVDGSVIINEQSQSTILQNNQFLKLEKGLGQVVPFNGQFYYLFGSGNSRSLRRADNINLTRNIATLTSITLPDANSWAEIRPIAGKLFVIIYENPQKQGQVILQSVENIPTDTGKATLNVVQNWQSIQSINFGPKNVLITTNAKNATNGTWETKNYDLENSTEMVLDNAKLRNLKVLGNFWANRCAFGVDYILCLAKVDAVSSISVNDPDKIIKIDKTGNMQILSETLIFSASHIFVDSENQIFIINPLKDLLYKLK